MTKVVWFTATIMLISLYCSCGSPLFNEESHKKATSDIALQEPTGSHKSSSTQGDGRDQNSDQNEKHSVEGDSDQTPYERFGCPVVFADVGLCARVSWFDNDGVRVTGPIRYRDERKGSILEVNFWTKTSAEFIDPRVEVSGVRVVAVKLWMACCVKGSKRPVVTYNSATKSFRFEKLHFFMSCPWQVKIQLKTEDNPDDYTSANDINVLDQYECEVKDLPLIP